MTDHDEVGTAMCDLILSGEIEGKTVDPEILNIVLADTAEHFNFTMPQLIKYLTLGAVQHPDALPTHCGQTDPRNEKDWCRRKPKHTGYHDQYSDEETDW